MKTVRRRRGSNAIEFVLCLPIWLSIVFAIMEFGWLFFNQTALDAAANLGCRAGSLVDPGNNDENIAAVQTRVLERMGQALLNKDGTECTDCVLTANTWGDPPGRSLRCEVSRPFDPLVGLYVSDGKSLSSSQIARLEWQRAAAP